MTGKQKKFCSEYLVDLNATQAAIRAGYSAETAGAIGAENLKKPQIRARIEKSLAEQSKRTGVTADRVVRELARIAFLKADDVIDMTSGSVKDNVSNDDLAAIASVRVRTIPMPEGNGVEQEIKFADKLKALELLGRRLGMFNDKLNVSGKINTGQLDRVLEQLEDDKDG